MASSKLKELKRRIELLEASDLKNKIMETALRESEEKYRTLTDNIAVGIFRSTPGPKGRFLEVNPALVKMLGYDSKDELLSTNVSDIYQNPEDREQFSNKMSYGGFLRNEELKFKRKDGTPITVSDTAIAVKDDGGKLLFFDGIIEDITERKAAEEKLQIQKAHYEELMRSALEAIVLHDNNDIVVDINEKFTRIFGYTREEAIGKQINELLVPEKFFNEASNLSSMVLRGKQVVRETQRRCKNGLLVDVLILGAPIFYEKNQIGVYAIYRDISKRKMVEQELNLQKTYREELFHSAPEAIILHDNNDIIVDVNREFSNMFGYTQEEALNRPINSLIADGELIKEAQDLSNRVINGDRVYLETKRKRKDGTLIDVSILGAPIIHEGNQIGVYAIYRDITEKKRAREARIKVREEARMARDIQINLLPKANPDIPGYDIAGKNIPAQNVGGDYYDFIPLDPNQLALCLGDVCGKGLPAALVMANLQATIRGQAFFSKTTGECLERSNKLLVHSTNKKTFISLYYAILQIENHRLMYSNAGHNRPVLFPHDKNPIVLDTQGLALGIKPEVEYSRNNLELNPGDLLLVYSDGISEAMNENMEEFGMNRIIDIVEEHRDIPAAELVERILIASIHHFGNSPQHDDMTLLILKRRY